MTLRRNNRHVSTASRAWSQVARAVRWCTVLAVGLTTVPHLAAASEAGAVDKAAAPGVVQVSAPVTPVVFDGDLRDIPAVADWQPGDPIRYVPRRYYPKPGTAVEPAPPPVVPDPLLDVQKGAPLSTNRAFNTPILSFQGIGFSGVFPPDTVGEVGPDHYIQAINGGGGTLMRIFDKNGMPLTAAIGLDTLWTGGGACATGLGDPIILYDEMAGRWMITEFASTGNNLCVYISQTGDPVGGGWFGYQFTTPNFPDYPKYGVWTNAYLVTANEGGNPPIYALDRARMLAGMPATFQRFSVAGLSGFGFEALTPADHDGPTPPPPGPGYIARHRDDESHGGPTPQDFLDIWSLTLDWVTPTNSRLTQLPSIAVSEFDSDLCGLSTLNCIPQPGTARGLDPLREVLMWRLQYRNDGGFETLVGNLVTDVDATDHAGIRWFELRKVGVGNWTLQQEGTYAPDATQRWMGSAAMDESGNIAIAYNTSDATTTFPSMAYTGRLSSDPPGMMTQGETTVAIGTNFQNGNRWGDYASLNVDPADGCTFWYTNEYMPSGSWGTWIASFKFDSCGCLAPPQAVNNPGASAVANNEIEIVWDDSATAAVSEYEIRRGLAPGGPYTPLTTVPDSSPGVGGGAPYAYRDVGVSGGTTYYYVIVARQMDGCNANSIEVSATATGPCLLAPTFAGLVSVMSPPDCTLDLDWDPATSNCGAAVTYDVHRSTTAGFMPTVANRIATGVVATDYLDTGVVGGTTYYYIVRAIDSGSGLDDGNTVSLSGVPGGAPLPPVNHPSTDTPRAIPDNNPTGVTSTIMVPSVGSVRTVVVNVDITHTWVGDIKIDLVAPDSTRVTLLDRPGVPTQSTVGCNNDNMIVTFDDLATMVLEDHCPNTTPWYLGVALPFSPLAAMVGKQAMGAWQLVVSDNAGQDLGMVNSWSIDLALAADCVMGPCNAATTLPIVGLLATKSTSRLDVEMTWQHDISAGEYNVRWVGAKPMIPARQGNGTDVCIAAALPPTPCIDAGAVPGTAISVRFYNVIGACNGTEAVE